MRIQKSVLVAIGLAGSLSGCKKEDATGSKTGSNGNGEVVKLQQLRRDFSAMEDKQKMFAEALYTLGARIDHPGAAGSGVIGDLDREMKRLGVAIEGMTDKNEIISTQQEVIEKLIAEIGRKKKMIGVKPRLTRNRVLRKVPVVNKFKVGGQAKDSVLATSAGKVIIQKEFVPEIAAKGLILGRKLPEVWGLSALQMLQQVASSIRQDDDGKLFIGTKEVESFEALNLVVGSILKPVDGSIAALLDSGRLEKQLHSALASAMGNLHTEALSIFVGVDPIEVQGMTIQDAAVKLFEGAETANEVGHIVRLGHSGQLFLAMRMIVSALAESSVEAKTRFAVLVDAIQQGTGITALIEQGETVDGRLVLAVAKALEFESGVVATGKSDTLIKFLVQSGTDLPENLVAYIHAVVDITLKLASDLSEAGDRFIDVNSLPRLDSLVGEDLARIEAGQKLAREQLDNLRLENGTLVVDDQMLPIDDGEKPEVVVVAPVAKVKKLFPLRVNVKKATVYKTPSDIFRKKLLDEFEEYIADSDLSKFEDKVHEYRFRLTGVVEDEPLERPLVLIAIDWNNGLGGIFEGMVKRGRHTIDCNNKLEASLDATNNFSYDGMVSILGGLEKCPTQSVKFIQTVASRKFAVVLEEWNTQPGTKEQVVAKLATYATKLRKELKFAKQFLIDLGLPEGSPEVALLQKSHDEALTYLTEFVARIEAECKASKALQMGEIFKKLIGFEKRAILSTKTNPAAELARIFEARIREESGKIADQSHRVCATEAEEFIVEVNEHIAAFTEQVKVFHEQAVSKGTEVIPMPSVTKPAKNSDEAYYHARQQAAVATHKKGIETKKATLDRLVPETSSHLAADYQAFIDNVKAKLTDMQGLVSDNTYNEYFPERMQRTGRKQGQVLARRMRITAVERLSEQLVSSYTEVVKALTDKPVASFTDNFKAKDAAYTFIQEVKSEAQETRF